MNLCGQLDNVAWRASPHRHAVALIDEARLYFRVFKAKEALVNYELLILWRQELFLLESVALRAMSIVQRLKFLLQKMNC